MVIGTGLSQGIPVLFSPVLARIFGPEQFGLFSVFIAASNILAILASGLYELAIVKAKKAIEAFQLLFLVQFLALSISSFLLIIALLIHLAAPGLNLFQLKGASLLLLPLSIYTIAIFNGLNYWLNRKRAYKKISTLKLIQSIGVTFISIFIGLIGFKEDGLIVGLIAGNLMTIIPLLRFLLTKRNKISLVALRKVATEHNAFPRLVLPTTLMNNLASYIPVFFITAYFTTEIVGNFAMTTRVLTAPVAIISTAISQIYYKEIANQVNNYTKTITPVFLKTSILLFSISLLIFLPLYFWGQDLFVYIFGSEWVKAGQYLKILVFGVILRFVSSPLSTTLIACGRMKLLSFWQITYFIGILASFYFSKDLPIQSVLQIYVVNDMVMYSFYFILIYKTVIDFDKQKKSDDANT